MSEMRHETDLLGERTVPADALYGIHTVRAVENFPLTGRRVHPELIHAFGAVKLACARTNIKLGFLADAQPQAIEQACCEMMEGLLDQHIIVDALQGGAGTSTNMNVNEVLANRALQLAEKPVGDYDTINPLEHINLHQSTNDTYPTALKIAAIRMLRELQQETVSLTEAFQNQETAMAGVVKIGRTQLQDAVLTTLGREMSSYAEAFGRDRWRIYKCEERLRVVNLGGTAIGTGMAAPRQYIFTVTDRLREITGLGLARAENMVEATQNTDVFVEVGGILTACASNLMKTATDLRLLSSGGFGELRLPPRQAGSSIMPSKVNPVIPEAVTQAAIAVMAHNQAIAQACSAGNLELNAFLPLVADSLLSGLHTLTSACRILRLHCVDDLQPDEEGCRKHLETATAAVTALVGTIGYKKAEAVALAAREQGKTIRQTVVDQNILSEEEFDRLMTLAASAGLSNNRGNQA